MNPLNLFRRKTSAILSSIKPDPLTDEEAKLVKSLRDHPEDWRVSRRPCGDEETQELQAIYSKDPGIRIYVEADAARAAAEGNPAEGAAKIGGYYFQSEFVRQFGALVYTTYGNQEAATKKASRERSLEDLKLRVSRWPK